MKRKRIMFLIFMISIFIFTGHIKADNIGSSLGCYGNVDKHSCQNTTRFSCIWNESEYGNYCNVDNLLYVRCGDAKDIPYKVPSIISFVVNLLKIAVPIILIIVSVIVLLKALAAQKEDEIKKAQSSLIKKLIAAVLVFFIISIVQFVTLKVADSEDEKNIMSCFKCFLNNECSGTVYYKASMGDVYYCISPETGKITNCETDEYLGNISSFNSNLE